MSAWHCSPLLQHSPITILHTLRCLASNLLRRPYSAHAECTRCPCVPAVGVHKQTMPTVRAQAPGTHNPGRTLTCGRWPSRPKTRGPRTRRWRRTCCVVRRLCCGRPQRAARCASVSPPTCNPPALRVRRASRVCSEVGQCSEFKPCMCVYARAFVEHAHVPASPPGTWP
eukprot:359937-Chlamydomonas_euryale.AAC.34